MLNVVGHYQMILPEELVSVLHAATVHKYGSSTSGFFL